MTTEIHTYSLSWHEGDQDHRRLPDGTYRDDEALGKELIEALNAVAREPRFDAIFPYGRNDY